MESKSTHQHDYEENEYPFDDFVNDVEMSLSQKKQKIFDLYTLISDKLTGEEILIDGLLKTVRFIIHHDDVNDNIFTINFTDMWMKIVSVEELEKINENN